MHGKMTSPPKTLHLAINMILLIASLIEDPKFFRFLLVPRKPRRDQVDHHRTLIQVMSTTISSLSPNPAVTEGALIFTSSLLVSLSVSSLFLDLPRSFDY